jgi:hypothetical protein
MKVQGLLSYQRKLVHHTTSDTVTKAMMITAFDQFVAQEDANIFAVVVLESCQHASFKNL